MKKAEIINWIEAEFKDFDEKLKGADKYLIGTYGLHYKNVCLMALDKYEKSS